MGEVVRLAPPFIVRSIWATTEHGGILDMASMEMEQRQYGIFPYRLARRSLARSRLSYVNEISSGETSLLGLILPRGGSWSVTLLTTLNCGYKIWTVHTLQPIAVERRDACSRMCNRAS